MKSVHQLHKSLVIISIVLLLTGCRGKHINDEYYPGGLIFPDSASLEEKEYMASGVVPLKKQFEWQQLEMTAFIHFSINTFTDKEWGDGTESESLFNPTELDAGQWVKTLHDAGIKMVILTAKHHDGFCLWPTRTTKHSVKSSPWKNGQGDVVKELRNACDKYDMKFGIYLSPWDRNAECYGNSPEYNKFFMSQLTELLSWYGRVDEVWFDGACAEGSNGKKQEYDWKAYYSLIHKLQPDAVVAIMGEDVRWVGTESGYGRDTEWSVTAFAPGGSREMTEINQNLGLNASSPDLGSSNILQKASRVFWYPSEVDVSIRPGWFYHHSEDNMVKSVNKLADIYFSSVGRNSLLLLNVPPDRRGLLNENDIKSLLGLKQYIDSLYKTDLLKGARPFGRGTSYAIDGDNTTSWKPDSIAVANFITPIPVIFNVVLLREDITKGQRVDSFTVEIKKDDVWKKITSGTTIGYKRLLRFPEVTADEIRLVINSSRAKPFISTFSLFKSPETMADPVINRNKEGNIIFSSDSPFTVFKFTTDGSEPNRFSLTWEGPVLFPDGGIVKCKSYINNFSDSSATFSEEFDIAPEKWKVIRANKGEPGFDPENAIDGDIETTYQTPWENNVTTMPHEMVIDLGETLKLYGFYYTPRHDENKSGTIERYRFYVSQNGEKWIEARVPGLFSNIKNNPVKQYVEFSKPLTARYIKFIATSGIYGEEWISIAEIGVITKP
jgi:alpha-L-fucosidase